MTTIAFVDTETSGLDPRHHDAWEVAVIRRETWQTDLGSTHNDYERIWQLPIPLTTADPKALEIGRYRDRFMVPAGAEAAEMTPDGTLLQRLTLAEMLFDLQDALQDAVLIGSNPAFDDAFLKKLLHAHERRIGWHYRTVDIATLAAGYRLRQASAGAMGRDFCFDDDYPTLPYSSRGLSRAVGVEPPGDDVAHTALGDARWCRDVYDAITKDVP